MFGKKAKDNEGMDIGASARDDSFAYVADDTVYADTACQSLRPIEVQQAITEYYQHYPACGGRVKYDWGKKVDAGVETTREKVLQYLKASPKDYSVSFTLNTTYGLNMLLGQINGKYDHIVTSDIEHNSVFLSTISASKRLGIERVVVVREKDGSVDITKLPKGRLLVAMNIASNIDGRELSNIKALVSHVHKSDGTVIIDAAQAMAHRAELLHGIDFDAVCFSAHKMYSASLGVVVAKKTLLDSLDYGFVGGGMVQDVTLDGYKLTSDDHSSRLEPGLQAFGEILALGTAIDWLKTKDNQKQRLKKLSETLEAELRAIDGLNVVSSGSAVISVYSDKIDAHRLATFLSAQGIMVRSGYFCCHYYLLHQEKLPPMVRFSLGLQSTESDVQKIISTMKKLIV